jgi:hypothetical protein
MNHYRNKLQTVQLEQTTSDLAKVQGMMAAAVNTFVPTINQAMTKVTAEITAFRDTVEKRINELSLKRQSQITKWEESAETDLAVLNEFTLKEQRKTLDLLNQSIANMSNAIKGYNEDIRQWGNIREEVGQYEQLLQNTTVLLAANKDPNLIAKLPSDFIISLLRGINIYVQVRLPDAKTRPSTTLQKEEFWAFSSTYEAKIKNVAAWLQEDLTRRHLEGLI